MSEPAPKSREEEKAFIREALDVLQEFTTGEGKLDGKKLCRTVRELRDENDRLRRILADLGYR